MTVKEFLFNTSGQTLRHKVECEDGWVVSIQASPGHYCSPRAYSSFYTSVELGFPSIPDPELFEYAENKENPADTIYGWVPLEVIEKVIAKHGGIKQ